MTVKLPTFLESVARVLVRKNSGATNVGARRRLNFIEGSGITLTVADDPTNEEIDVTITGPAGGNLWELNAGTLAPAATPTSFQVEASGSAIVRGSSMWVVSSAGDTRIECETGDVRLVANDDVFISPGDDLIVGCVDVSIQATGDVTIEVADDLALSTSGAGGHVTVTAAGASSDIIENATRDIALVAGNTIIAQSTGQTTLTASLLSVVAAILATNGAIRFDEIADPSAPAANKGYLYMRDNGAGKTQFVARFPSGAVQVIATEP